MPHHMLSLKWNANIMKHQYFLFIIIAILCQSIGGIFGKFAALSLHVSDFFAIVTNVFYLLGLVCMFLQAIVWQQALIHFPLSFAYPFMSLFNFIVLIASAVLFHEGITNMNVIGLGIISMGITMLFSSGKRLCLS
ncbi:4-amino-4-deoxy-L-arabinose-phosphoundecaprenol flippase subunit ArnE [anaerobic digester metagenome]